MQLNGFININKPLGITSNDTLFKIKRILFPHFGKVKIGHTGTLDPLATGVLPIALGEATKTIQFQMENIKTYEFNIMFGKSTTTDDGEGEVNKTSTIIPTLDEVENILEQFKGEILQTPPNYSAVKINGVRAYKLARNEKDFEIQPRPNFIHEIKVIKQISAQEVKLEVSANKGFYVRSIARDIAKSLGSCGYVSYLERLKNGVFDIKDSISLDKLQEIIENGFQSLDVRNCIGDFLLPVSCGLNGILVLDIQKESNEKLRNGIKLPSIDFKDIKANTLYQVHYNNTLQAIVKNENEYLKIIRIFNL